jgi:Tfp pilus assembly protein PilN
VSQVNLLPPEIRARQAVRRTTGLILAIGAGVAALIIALFFVQSARLSSAQEELTAQEQTNAALQQQIGELQPYVDLQAQLLAKQAIVDAVYVNEISWSGVLLDLSRIIPEESYLSSMSGQLAAIEAAPTEVAPTEGGLALIGAISFQCMAQGTDTIATWLTRLDQVDGWVNAWANSAAENGDFTRIYTFDSAVDLTTDAATDRGRGEGQQ